MGLTNKNPLLGVFFWIFLHSLFYGASFLYDVYRYDFSYQKLPSYISVLVGLIFLYCYIRNIKFAWHFASCWLFFVCFGVIVKATIYGVDPSRPYGRPWIQTKEDVIVVSLVALILLASYMWSRYKPYMNFIKDLTSHYDE